MDFIASGKVDARLKPGIEGFLCTQSSGLTNLTASFFEKKSPSNNNLEVKITVQTRPDTGNGIVNAEFFVGGIPLMLWCITKDDGIF